MVVNGVSTFDATNQFVRIVRLPRVVDNAREFDVSIDGFDCDGKIVKDFILNER